MGVLNGQNVDQGVTNPAFIIKNADDSMPNKLGFTRPLSGPNVADIQKAVNAIYGATGVSEVYDGTTYSAPASTIDDGDDHQTALYKLAFKFDPTDGHKHTGAAGDAPEIPADSVVNSPGAPLPVRHAGGTGNSGAFAWSNHEHPFGIRDSMTMANNQSSPASVIGIANGNLVIDGSLYRGFTLEYQAYRNTTGGGATEEAQKGILVGVYSSSAATWEMSEVARVGEAGVDFLITSAGQIQYESSNITGTPATSKLSWNHRTEEV